MEKDGFSRGFSSALSLFPNSEHQAFAYDGRDLEHEDDAEALAADWAVVGSVLSGAIYGSASESTPEE